MRCNAMKNKKKMKATTIRLPTNLYKQLVQEIEELREVHNLDISISCLVRKYIHEGVKND